MVGAVGRLVVVVVVVAEAVLDQWGTEAAVRRRTAPEKAASEHFL